MADRQDEREEVDQREFLRQMLQISADAAREIRQGSNSRHAGKQDDEEVRAEADEFLYTEATTTLNQNGPPAEHGEV